MSDTDIVEVAAKYWAQVAADREAKHIVLRGLADFFEGKASIQWPSDGYGTINATFVKKHAGPK